MTHRKKPWILGVYLAALLAGCAQKQNSSQLTIWHWMSDREDTLQELAGRYETATGIPVRFELFAPSEAYSQKVKAAAQTNTLPDVFGVLGEKRDLASFILSGHVANIAEEINDQEGAWRKLLFEKPLLMNEFDAGNGYGVPVGTYGVPLDVMNIQFLYNKDLFRQAGLDPNKPPVTWRDFLAANAKLKEKGIQGLVSGWGEIWLIECLASNFAWNIMGQDKILATLKGKVLYTDSDWVRVLKLFQEMRDQGALAEGVVTMINKRAEQIFANGQAAFAMNGSWCVNVYHGMNPSLDYGVMLPPRVSNTYPQVIWGGAGSNFMVNAKSVRKEQAAAFLKWLTAKEQQVYLATQTRNLPSNREALVDLPPILAEFVNDMDRTVHPSLMPLAEFPLVTEAMTKGIQSILIGEKTPEELAAQVQAVKDRELEKQMAQR
ncbi:MAG: extracellular solute-binding protein [Candidatus Omnitrophica bacterium]|nr:extracellular solute-binding protein [Candidatus Omnitrophota bacterium]